ncbi:MAG: hypothetical protein ABR616_18290 [Dermatophilaceae bacterium]
MACNCRKNRTQPVADRYVLTASDGTTSTHGSRLEAEAENAKTGGGGKVRPA